MSSPRDNSQQPSNPRRTCARTDAVLAVHLDGDLERESFDREACEPLGYGFVSDDSLHTHLRECETCQLALQRARRLDAALASMAGRAVADQVAASGCSMEELSDQWLNCAALAASGSKLEQIDLERGDVGSDGATAAEETIAAEQVAADDLDWLFDRALDQPADPSTESNKPRASRVGTLIAIAGVMAACLATWLCIAAFDKPELVDHQLAVTRSDPVHETSPANTPEQEAAATLPVADDGERSKSPLANGVLDSQTDTPEASNRPRRSLVRSMHAARNRELPEQRTAQPTDLSRRVRDRALSVPARLAAAHRLLRATRAGSSAARHATDQLLLALAGCGDLNQDDVALHEQLLDEVRSNGPVLVRLEHRLVSLPSRNRDGSELTHKALAAILVAARVENDRLDQALRRALRRNDAIADVVASALRCGVRANGATKLLLDCWHDQVAIGKQQNTQQWAEFWFRGQAAANFARLKHVHARSHSAPERVRCLLAMGCVHDNSTVAPLLAGLVAPRRVEACAAACGLASLPHRVLKQLLPKAKLHDSGLLRAALARAGLPESKRWIQALALNKPQLQLMRTGPISRFSEVASWFRKGLLTAD